MLKMAPSVPKRRKLDNGPRSDPVPARRALRDKSRFDSDSDDQPVDSEGVSLPSTRGDGRGHDAFDQELEADGEEHPDFDSDETDRSSDGDESDTTSHPDSKKRKRNDPDAFATSMSKILGSKLSTSKRSDPVLARSNAAATASHELADARLAVKARHRLREEKKAELDRGRVKDVLGVGEGADTPTAAETREREKGLRKTAQRGVVKLFNAVRAAQVKGEQAAREAKEAGVFGAGRREERVTEMSKKGFLDLLAGGGSKGTSRMLEEA